MILANPPFAGNLDNETASKDLLKVVNTKKTELLFLALFLRMLATGGRAAVIVPDGVLFGSSKAHKGIRQKLVDEHRLEAVTSLWSESRPVLAILRFPIASSPNLSCPCHRSWSSGGSRRSWTKRTRCAVCAVCAASLR